MLQQLPNASAIRYNQSAHFSMVDEPGPMNDAIANFFDTVEQEGASGRPFTRHYHHGDGDITPYSAAVVSSLEFANASSSMISLSGRSFALALLAAFSGGIALSVILNKSRRRRNSYSYEALP